MLLPITGDTTSAIWTNLIGKRVYRNLDTCKKGFFKIFLKGIPAKNDYY
jgi:hypothetical protein